MRFSKVLLTVFCLAMIPVIAGAATINEIRVDQAGTDNDEYFELLGMPGESLDGLTYITTGDGLDVDACVVGTEKTSFGSLKSLYR